MKNLLTLFAVLTTAFAAKASYVDLVSFGNSDFSVDGGATTATYTQSASGLNFSGTVVLSDTLGGTFNAAPLNWNSYNPSTDFAVKLSVVGANPALPFTLTLFDSSFNLANFTGFTSGATTDSYVPLTLSGPVDPAVTAALSAAAGAQLTWDGGGTSVNVTVQSFSAVPEPSTYALLSLAGLALGGYAMRRRRRA